MMQTCKTCKYWGDPSQKERGEENENMPCMKIPHIDSAVSNFEYDIVQAHMKENNIAPSMRGWGQFRTDATRQAVKEYRENLKQIPAHVEDASSYYARLYSKAEFGCVLHEAK